MTYTANQDRDTFERIDVEVETQAFDILNTWMSAQQNGADTCTDNGIPSSVDDWNTPSDDMIRHTLGTLESLLADGYPGADFFAKFGIKF